MIRTENLSKKYPNGTLANANLSIYVKKKECVGILGPNGSGKTTLIRQILKLVQPTAGSIEVDEKQDYLKKIGYAPQQATIFPALTVAEAITYTLRYKGIPKSEAKNKAYAILKELNLTSIEKTLCYMLSGGQRKMLSFACALAQNTPYLIFDEPTAMLDIVSKERVWDAIQVKRANCGVLLATHDMEEVRHLCSRIYVLSKGKVIFSGDPKNLPQTDISAEISVSDKGIMQYLKAADIAYEEKGEGRYVLYFKELVMAIKSMDYIQEQYQIDYILLEYPSLSQGVLNLVQN